jgi:uncharacterized protein YjbI with pentapeptide repeats
VGSINQTVFISYRRDVSSFTARLIFKELTAKGYDVFMDVESLDSGTFDTVIMNQISARAHFIIILEPGSVTEFTNSEDWLRKEVEHAITLKRNIIPVLVGSFTFEENQDHLPGMLTQLARYNAIKLSNEYFDAAMSKLSRFLKQPVHGEIHPAPESELPVVRQKIQKTLLETGSGAATHDAVGAGHLTIFKSVSLFFEFLRSAIPLLIIIAIVGSCGVWIVHEAYLGLTSSDLQKALRDLGANERSRRLDAIATLQSIAQDTDRDKDYKGLIHGLCSYVRKAASRVEGGSRGKAGETVQNVLDLVSKRRKYYNHGETERLNLSQIDVKGVSLPEAHLEGADISGSNFEGAYLRKANFEEAHLDGIDLRNAHLEKSNLNKASLEPTHDNQRPSLLENAVLVEAYLQFTKLRGAKLKEAELERAHLEAADLAGADIRNAKLKGANLSRANLRAADLRGADLENAILQGADLSEARLEGAKFAGTDFRTAILKNAHLEGSNLSLAVGITKEQIRSSTTDKYTVLPLP